NVVQLKLPPLRERGKDILTLAETFVQRYCAELKKPPLVLSPEAIQAITTYTWPGNIRELENAIQRAVILCEDEREISHSLLAIDLDLVKVDDDDGPTIGETRQRHTNSDPNED